MNNCNSEIRVSLVLERLTGKYIGWVSFGWLIIPEQSYKILRLDKNCGDLFFFYPTYSNGQKVNFPWPAYKTFWFGRKAYLIHPAQYILNEPEHTSMVDDGQELFDGKLYSNNGLKTSLRNFYKIDAAYARFFSSGETSTLVIDDGSIPLVVANNPETVKEVNSGKSDVFDDAVNTAAGVGLFIGALGYLISLANDNTGTMGNSSSPPHSTGSSESSGEINACYCNIGALVHTKLSGVLWTRTKCRGTIEQISGDRIKVKITSTTGDGSERLDGQRLCEGCSVWSNCANWAKGTE
ncbi:MAG: hypothetical protein Q7J34_14340 [Bacteroidales bacterium]|nr:hypothetical protein [Bacteroidales bacterium]